MTISLDYVYRRFVGLRLCVLGLDENVTETNEEVGLRLRLSSHN